MAAEIDWMLLGIAVDYFKGVGYTYIEADWAISDEIVAITAPFEEWRAPGRMGMGTLVGSAEQSFLALDLAGKLPKGDYVACTPCFRPAEEMLDDLHQRHFMKVELYSNRVEDEAQVQQQMMRHASTIFLGYGAQPHQLKTVPTDQGLDLEVNGIEVGSYGVRQHGDHRWIYGTGLALPRFSQALSAA